MKKLVFLIISLLFSSVTLADEFLLKPSGEYKVGYQDFHWINGEKNSDRNYVCPDKNQDPFYKYGETKDNFSSNNQISFCRELMVRVYFPITDHLSKPRQSLYPPMVQSLKKGIKSLNVPTLNLKDYLQYETTKTDSYSFNNDYLNNEKFSVIPNKKFPVIFFTPGNGDEFQDYGNVIFNLVGHGYIVVGVNITFVSDAIWFPTNENMEENWTKGRIAYRNKDLINAHSELDSTLPSQDVLFAMEKTKQMNLQSNNILFSHMDMNKFATLGHSMGANTSVMIAQNNDAVSEFNIKAVGSLDTGFGVFESANCVDTSTGKIVTSIPQPTLNFNSAGIGTSIPFMHLHSSAQEFGCVLPLFYVIQNTISPDQKLIHNPNEYWVYLAPEKTFNDIPTELPVTPPTILPMVFPDDVYYSAHQNFSDNGTLQYLPLFKKTTAYIEPKMGKTEPFMVGNVNGFEIAKTINLYLLNFFDQYLKNKQSEHLNSCTPMSDDTMMECHTIR